MHVFRIRSSVAVLVFFAVLACQSAQGDAQTTPSVIGTYDGRAVVIAFAGSDVFKQSMQTLRGRVAEAKAAGDQGLVDKLEAEAVAQQERFHGQAFRGEGIDDILGLAQVAGAVEVIRVAAGAAQLQRVNAVRASDASTVDVTEQLVALFHPDERAQKWIREIRAKPFPK